MSDRPLVDPEIPRPTLDDVETTLRLCAPDLATAPVEPLGEGWDTWVFAAGDYVLRIPKRAKYAGRLEDDSALLEALAPTLPCPVPTLVRRCPDGPNARPFSVYRRVPGVPLIDLQRPPASTFGRDLGRFFRALHAFPVERAIALGVRPPKAPEVLGDRIAACDRLVRRVFPLLVCETRTHVERVLESYLNDPALLAVTPALCHGDIDDRNVLADPETGELGGVIDFGDAEIYDAAWDFVWPYCIGFAALGIEEQIPDLLREGGVTEADAQRHCAFNAIWWHLHDTAHGLDIGDASFVEEGLRGLNAAVPRGLRCD